MSTIGRQSFTVRMPSSVHRPGSRGAFAGRVAWSVRSRQTSFGPIASGVLGSDRIERRRSDRVERSPTDLIECSPARSHPTFSVRSRRANSGSIASHVRRSDRVEVRHTGGAACDRLRATIGCSTTGNLFRWHHTRSSNREKHEMFQNGARCRAPGCGQWRRRCCDVPLKATIQLPADRHCPQATRGSPEVHGAGRSAGAPARRRRSSGSMPTLASATRSSGAPARR